MQDTSQSRLARAIGYAERIAAGNAPAVVLQCVSDAVVITDNVLDRPGPTIIFANIAFQKLTGYGFAELVGQSPRLLQGYDTDYADLARMRETLEARDCFQGEVLNYHKSGIEYVVGWAIAPIGGTGNDIRRWLSVQNDVLGDARTARHGIPQCGD